MVTKVDPFLIPIPRGLLANPETREYFEYLNRFLHDLWVRTGGGEDAISENETDTDSIVGEIRKNSALNNRLLKRVDNIESQLDFDSINSRIAQLNRKVTRLITELLEEVKKLQPDKEAQSHQIAAIEQINKELRLMNARIEEAFETKIVEEDIN